MGFYTQSSPTAPAVPLTLEGASVLHQIKRVRWPQWRQVAPAERQAILAEAADALAQAESEGSAAYSLLGHKGDLLLVHFRNSFQDLHAVEARWARLRLSDYLEDASSYLSVVELGLYDSSAKTYAALEGKGLEPHSPEWLAGVEEVLERQRTAMHPRLFPSVPEAKFICFYPMDRKRGEGVNWYTLPMEERQRMMHEHGMIGRRYAGVVRQVISGSIGFDDWEWGVDLFADDPVVFKRLIYEMRFDEVSAVYALFGTFYVGLRVPPARLAEQF